MELLIALTLFAIVSVTSVMVMSNVLRSSKKIAAQAFLYTEAQNLMDQIEFMVSDSALDYEGYYARNILGEDWNTPHYGYYGQAFFSPGDGGPVDAEEGPYGEGGYGVACPSDPYKTWPIDCSDETPLASQFDQNLGVHPIPGAPTSYTQTDEPTAANAFCKEDIGGSCEDFAYGLSRELILINADGDERIVLTPLLLENGTSLGKLVLTGADSNEDAIADEWTCLAKYVCANPNEATLEDFKAISPAALDILEFSLMITPTEDPYRAFGEADVQVQPMVTVFLTVSLSDDYDQGRLGNGKPVIRLQRSISTGVTQLVPSYL